MSFARRAIQLETAPWSPAFAMQLSKVVKTLVLGATKVPKRTANTTPYYQRQRAAHNPCYGLPGIRRALRPPAGDGNAAEDHRDEASQQAKREQDKGHDGHEAGHAEH